MKGNSNLIVGIVLAALLLYLFTSSGEASAGATQTPASAQGCYSQASGIVSPDWAGMNKLQRAVLAMQVINTCEAVR